MAVLVQRNPEKNMRWHHYELSWLICHLGPFLSRNQADAIHQLCIETRGLLMKVMVTTEREEDRPHIFLEIKMNQQNKDIGIVAYTTLMFESSLAPNAILNRLCTMISSTSYKA